MAAILGSYRDAIAFRPERFNPVLVASGSHMKAVLTCLEPGQFIPVHHPGIDMLLIVLKGEGEVVSAIGTRPPTLERSSLPLRARLVGSGRKPG